MSATSSSSLTNAITWSLWADRARDVLELTAAGYTLDDAVWEVCATLAVDKGVLLRVVAAVCQDMGESVPR